MGLFQPVRVAGDQLLGQVAGDLQRALGNEVAELALAFQEDGGVRIIVDADAVLLAVIDTAHFVVQRVVLSRIEIEGADGILPSVPGGVLVQAEHGQQVAPEHIHLQRTQQEFQLMPERDGHAYAPVSVCMATRVASCTPSISSMRPTRSAFWSILTS